MRALTALADTRGIADDRELSLCASFLHDAGLYGPASSGDVYIKHETPPDARPAWRPQPLAPAHPAPPR
jgi:hypothetical protein